ncbi:hypothetical protein DSCO28_02060 [Desulfosarcina ovata subsp. sediminis]|uniref:Lipoprotein n=1 Tax=Desulfosarcina ovata subsp. sediminis TaxID=885957 RepID=A0A5K7ZME8_9BACT|nr:hypothetical protein [Desulfosarcina ovata]BBO79640.1 hypothetical protein DSCO28_02060 [Desulfosarcina ovata subsp. sediminis]
MKLIHIVIGLLALSAIMISQAACSKDPGVSSANTSYEEVDQIRDVSMYGGKIKRIVAHIVIPLGRTNEEVRETLKKAAIEIGNREHAKATTVKGYRPQDKDRTGQWTVGQATYAPNGRWEDADTNSPLSVTVELSKDSLYFQKEEASKIGKNFILKEQGGGPVEISKYRDNWGDKDIIAKLPSGTDVTIIERYEKPITSEMLLTRVRVRDEKNEIEGWVFGEDVAPKE